MPFLLEYILKVSVSLALVYLFYHVALRRLTFYNWNRWYLLAYTFISFLVPFIDVSSLLNQSDLEKGNIVYLIPSFQKIGTALPENNFSEIDIGWRIVTLIILAGIICMILRMVIQLLGYKKILTQSRLVTSNGVKVYEVSKPIIPFSFGRSVFINRQLHSENELAEIVKHEFVHVRQMHTIDILWGEFLCIINWFNPFVWLIRKAIRQNLEFIADNKVLQEGIDKKEYQYLLLKVTGNNHYSIANQFNFSSLKKRIAMMNKMRSAQLHLLKFLFILPLIAVMLLVFRTEVKSQTQPKQPVKVKEVAVSDTVSVAPVAINSKGYYIDVIGVKGNCIIVVKDKNRKVVESIWLTKWNEREEYYENLYGEIPPPPPPPPPAPPAKSKANVPTPPLPPSPPTPVNIKDISLPPTPPVPVEEKGIKNRTSNIKKPDFEFHQATFVADVISFNSRDKSFNLKGKAVLNDEVNDVNFSAELINLKDIASFPIMINGKEVEWDKDYINEKREKYIVSMINKEEAFKKYGEKGKDGILEISSIAL